MPNLTCYCENCTVIDACKFTFGKYWDGKSGAGEGCNHPITEAHAKAVIASKAYRMAHGTENMSQASFGGSPVGVSATDSEREWEVLHLRKKYQVTANSSSEAEDAICKRLYGDRDKATVAPFYASLKQCGKLTVNNIAERLRRMA